MNDREQELKTNPEAEPSNQNRVIKTPPFRFYIVIAFFLSLFILIQDGIYRTNGFLIHMKPGVLFQNTLLMLSFFIVIFFFVSFIFFLIDKLLLLIFRKELLRFNRFKSEYFSNPSCFLFFLVFIYILLTYLKFFLISSFPVFTVNNSVEKATILIMGLFILLTIVYQLFLKKHVQYVNMEGFIKKASLPVEIISLIVIITGFVFVLIANVIPVRKNQAEKKKPDIILFTMDSVRTKSMSAYGYKRNTTPFISKFANNSYVFHNMESCSNLTYVCLPAILNGRYPKKTDEMNSFDKANNLIDVLKKNGYKEAIFVSQLYNFEPTAFTEYANLSTDKNTLNSLHLKQINKRLSWILNYLSQDERYFHIWSITDPKNLDFNRISPDMDVYLSYLVDKLAYSNEPTFLWIHLLQAHHPFEYPPYMKGLFKGSPVRFIDLYDTSILYLDHIFEKFDIELANHGLKDNTLIIVSSDHGFSFPNDLPYRGPFQATSMTNGTFNIPFIVKMPGQKKRVDVKTIVSQIDIAPTILDLIGCGIPENIKGESMRQYMEQPDKMSKIVKYSILAQYFLKKDTNSKNAKWADDDFANVFYDRYMVQLSLFNPAENRFTDDDMKMMVAGPDFTDVGEENKPPDKRNQPGKFVPKPPPFPKGIDFLNYKCYGVFDIISDPDFKENLRDTKTGKEVLDVIKESEMVRYYQDVKH